MKIIHTSDWHLGKKLKNRDRIDEQRIVLFNFVNYVKSVNADLVIIAGDVYDTYSPSADAEELFFSVIKALSDGERAVVIISGNHDDSDRLFAARVLCEDCGVFFADGKPYKNVKLKNVSLTFNKDCAFIFEDNSGEKIFINALSYPTEARLKEKIDDNESYDDKIKRWILNGSAYNTENLPEILVSHLFMLGGESSSTERAIDLGGARRVSRSVINDNCVYTALGHLHKRQTVSKEKNVYYSGSILEYAFDEAGVVKSFKEFDVTQGVVNNVKDVEFTGGKKLKSIEVIGFINCDEVLKSLNDCYVELILHTDKPLTTEESRHLYTEHANLVNVEIITKEDEIDLAAVDRRKLSDEELFTAYYKSQYGSEPDSEILQLFLKIMSTGDM